MSLAMAALHTLPTVASVAAIVDPYGVALQQYEATLSQATLGASATSWRTTVLDQTQRLTQLLGTLPATPPAHLGEWISGYYLQTAQLQSAIEELEAALGQRVDS
jgi:hypothetical protein